MSELLAVLVATGVPIVAALLVSAFSVVAFGLFVTNGRIAMLLFLAVILCSSNPSYGFLAPVGFSVYYEGSRTLFFPLIQFYLYGMFLAALYGDAFAGRTTLKHAGQGWMAAFAVLFVCQMIYGLAVGVGFAPILSSEGLINVLHMSMIAYVTVSALRDRQSLTQLLTVLLGVAVLRGCYGLGRFVLLGGDPQNAYANIIGLNLKITFWDFNEGLIASLVVFYCAGRLLRDWRSLAPSARLFFTAAIPIELLVLLFSYRRTNWFGFLLAGGYFVWLLPKRTRAATAMAFVLLAVPVVLYLSTQRQQETLGRGQLSWIERIAPDVNPSEGLAARGSRLYELYRALDTVMQHPVIGVGPWGQFEVAGSATGLEYHAGSYGFVHSGFGHIVLKSGAVGLVLFCGMLLAPWWFARRARGQVAPEHLALFQSFRAGLIFLTPVLLFGTPIIEFRSMILLGVLLAVPVAIARLAGDRDAPSMVAFGRPAHL